MRQRLDIATVILLILCVIVFAGGLILSAVTASAAPLPFCTQKQLRVHAYEQGDCRIWLRNASGGGQHYGRKT